MFYKSLRAPGLKSDLSNLKYIDILCSTTRFIFYIEGSLQVSVCVCLCVYLCARVDAQIPSLHWAKHRGAWLSVWLCWVHAETLNPCVFGVWVYVCVQGPGSSSCCPGGSEPISCCAV